MNKTTLTFTLALTVGLASSVTAHATIIDNGTYTTDTTSGLDWLDVTSSVNLSYNYVTSQFGAGGLFEGWRYASGDEFNVLVSDYTGVSIPAGYYGATFQEPDLIDGLVMLLDGTCLGGCPPDLAYTAGFITDLQPGTINHYAALLWDNDRGLPQEHYLYVDYSAALWLLNRPPDQPQSDTGSFLVRNTIPEPSVITLLAIGLIGIGMSRVKRHKVKTA